jgi:hypothetical protein
MTATSQIPPDEWDLVGGDPTPGEPDGIRAKANSYRSIAENARTCRDSLEQLATAGGDSWLGQAADQFRTQLEKQAKLPGDLGKLDTSFSIAADALRRYGNRIEELQAQAAEAVRRAVAGDADARQAEPKVTSGERLVTRLRQDVHNLDDYLRRLTVAMQNPAYSDPNNRTYHDEVDRRYHGAVSDRSRASSELGDANRNLDGARRSLDDARARLRAARGAIDRVREDREGVVGQTVSDLRDASRAGVQNRKWWQKAIDEVREHWADVLETISNFLDKYGWLIEIAVMVVAVLLAPLTGGASVAFAVTALKVVSMIHLAIDVVLFFKGRKKLSSVAWDTLAVLPMGKVASKMKAAGKTAVTTVAMRAARISGRDASKSAMRQLLKTSGQRVLTHFQTSRPLEERLMMKVARRFPVNGPAEERLRDLFHLKTVVVSKDEYVSRLTKGINDLVETPVQHVVEERLKPAVNPVIDRYDETVRQFETRMLRTYPPVITTPVPLL